MNKTSRSEDESYEWEAGAPGKPRLSSALARCDGRRHSGEVRAWKQTPKLDREQAGRPVVV